MRTVREARERTITGLLSPPLGILVPLAAFSIVTRRGLPPGVFALGPSRCVRPRWVPTQDVSVRHSRALWQNLPIVVAVPNTRLAALREVPGDYFARHERDCKDPLVLAWHGAVTPASRKLTRSPNRRLYVVSLSHFRS